MIIVGAVLVSKRRASLAARRGTAARLTPTSVRRHTARDARPEVRWRGAAGGTVCGYGDVSVGCAVPVELAQVSTSGRRRAARASPWTIHRHFRMRVHRP